jgi:putative addiction module component (TIGR02574 family)
MIDLTEEQRRQLENGKAVDVTDAQTAQPYVVLRKDVFERVRNLLYDDSEWTEDELRLQLGRSARDNGWDEPGMDAYDRYDEELRKRLAAELDRRLDKYEANPSNVRAWDQVMERVRRPR